MLGLLVALSALCSSVRGQDCTQTPRFYEDEGFTVHRVTIDAPLAWIAGVDVRLDELLSKVPLKEGGRFTVSGYNQGFLVISRSFPELRVNPSSRIALRLERPALSSCNSDSKQLDVVYHVYTIGFSPYLTRVFESPRDEVTRSVTESSETKAISRFFFQPFIEYDKSRNTDFGTYLRIEARNPLFDSIDVKASGSNTALDFGFALRGSRSFASAVMSFAEWNVEYHYLRDPGPELRFDEAWLSAQFLAATKPVGRTNLVFRFGAAVEGGHKQSNIPVSDIPLNNIQSAPYGAVKIFGGASFRSGRNSFKGSYGLELGGAGENIGLDYVKQIVDTAYETRFLPALHRPVTLSTQFTAGIINTINELPVAARFFGGNLDSNFLMTRSWSIRNEPYIRSFSPNGLSRSTITSGPVGGDRFFSANVTVSATVWGIPMVPRQILDDPDFSSAFDLSLSSAESVLTNEYVGESPELLAIAGSVRNMPALLEQFRTTVSSIRGAPHTAEIDEQLNEVDLQFASVSELSQSIIDELAAKRVRTAGIRTLVVGFPARTPPVASYVEELTGAIELLASLVGGESAQSFRRSNAELEAIRKSMAQRFRELEASSTWSAAQKRATRDMRYPRQIVSELTREANLIGISPVAMFDAARVSIKDGPAADVRFALGTGLRFSIVSLDVTVGYAWNLRRRPGDPRGAVLFTMELSNLFR